MPAQQPQQPSQQTTPNKAQQTCAGSRANNNAQERRMNTQTHHGSRAGVGTLGAGMFANGRGPTDW